MLPEPSVKQLSFTRKDFAIIAILCFLYSIVAFWQLGSTKAPVTEHTIAPGEYFIIDLGEHTEVTSLSWYVKESNSATLQLDVFDHAAGEWVFVQAFTPAQFFGWEKIALHTAGQHFLLSSPATATSLTELVLQGPDGSILTPINAVEMPALFDEAATYPEMIDYRSGSYFDEIYYTQTVHDLQTGSYTYENTHPPLGKIIMWLGTLLFGTSAFGFRFMGALFGVLMLPFLYLLGRDLTKSRMLGAFAASLFACDFMHFTQTRLATIDVFITFFIILMFYFMYQYQQMSFYRTSLGRTLLPLGACGVAFGFGIACKWTGFYAGAGLAILFFMTLYKRFREYKNARKKPRGETDGIQNELIIRVFPKYAWKTVGFCIVFFLVIPFCIYLLSYLPFRDGTDRGLLARMWQNQLNMYDYHSNLVAEHPYSSLWYQWPIMTRPVFYYANSLGNDMRQGISAFGNPLVWWAGIPAFFHMLYLIVRNKKECAKAHSSVSYVCRPDQNAVFLCICYLSCFLPWCFVTRCTFMYHYFPSVPVVVCMITYSLAQWRKHLRPRAFALLLLGYATLALFLFALFYPVLSGQPVDKYFVADYLRWLPGWVLVLMQ